MIFNDKISNKDRRQGQRLYGVFSICNAVSYICLADSIFILFALKMGCPDYVVAILTSFMYLGNLSMFLSRKLIGRFGAARTISIFWLTRNMAGMLTASAPYLALHVSHSAGIASLIFGALIFYFSRSGGVLAIQPIIGEITFPEKRGQFVSNIYLIYNITAVIAFSILIYLFKEESNIGLFQKILLFGASIGLISIGFIWNIKETSTPMISARLPIKNEFSKIMSNSTYRKLLLCNILVFSGIVLVVPISMLALKEGYNIPNYQALTFSLIQFAGGILIAYISRFLSDETGPRPLLIIYFCLLGVISLFWVAAPSTFQWGYIAIIFLLCGCCFMGISLMLVNYFLAAVKEKDRVGASLFISISSGIGAGIVGAVLGSGVLKLLHCLEFNTPLLLYKIYFAFVFLLLVPAVYFITKLEKQSDWAVKDVLGLLVAPRDIRALLLINSIETIETPVKENVNIHKLERIPSGLSEKKLLAYLESPKFYIRGQALHALRLMPLDTDAQQALIRELDRGEFTTAFYAAQTLGEQNIQDAIPVLTQKLNSKDSYLKGKAMHALAIMKNKPTYNTIEKIFKETNNPRLIIHGALALAEIGNKKAIITLLDKTTQEMPQQVMHEIIMAIAEISGIPDGFYKFLKHFMLNRKVSKSNLPEYLDSLSTSPMPEPITKLLEHVIESNDAGDSKKRLLDTMLTATKKHQNDMTIIIHNFLSSCDENKISEELLYLLLCILRRHGVFDTIQT